MKVLSLPILPQGQNICPCCKKRLRKTTGEYRVSVKGVYRTILRLLNYCARCNIYYGTQSDIDRIRRALIGNGNNSSTIYAPHFPAVSLGFNDIYPKTYGADAENSTLASCVHETVRIEQVPRERVNPEAAAQGVYPCPINLAICPKCGKPLRKYVFPLPVSRKTVAKVPGVSCFSCNAFFTLHRSAVYQARDDSDQLSVYSEYDTPYDSKVHNDIWENCRSACYQITVCTEGDIRTYTITNDREEAAKFRYTLHYTDSLALDLLTAIYLKASTVKIKKTQYTVQNIRMRSASAGNGIQVLLPQDPLAIVKEHNGGFYDPREHIELVHGLVFCEYSQRLEIIPVSYDKVNRHYYVDQYRYNQFCQKHGWPIVRYVARERDELYDLRDESLLHCLGYNVGKKDSLNDATRQSILSRFVDLGFGDVSSVVKLLSTLVRLNKQSRPDCCRKWEKDLDFITNYRVNPSRFVFITKIRNLCSIPKIKGD